MADPKVKLPGEYVEAANGTTHIVGWPGFSALDATTLCGRNARNMLCLDQTLSGMAATCKTCKRRFREQA